MAVLARATCAEIEACLERAPPLPEYEIIVAPHTGTVMVEGRAGGGGTRFNLGEATLTKTVVRSADGTLGFCYSLGRDPRKAVLAAALDAALQTELGHRHFISVVIEPLATIQCERRVMASRRAAATKVDFFVLQRGEAS